MAKKKARHKKKAVRNKAAINKSTPLTQEEIDQLVKAKTNKWNMERERASHKELNSNLNRIKQEYDTQQEYIKSSQFIADKAKEVNIAPELKSDVFTNPYDKVMELYKSGSRDDLKKAYGNLDGKEITKFREYMYQDRFKNEIHHILGNDIEDFAFNMDSHIKNTTRSARENNVKLNAVGVDPHVEAKLTKDLRTEIHAGNEYISNVKKSIFDSNGKVRNYDNYGKVVNELEKMEPTSDNFIKTAEMLNLDRSGTGHKGSLSEKDMKKFVKRTYDGGDVDAYMKRMNPYLPYKLDEGDEYFTTFKSFVKENGAKLKKEQDIDNMISSRVRQNTKEGADNLIAKQKRKEEKLLNKNNKKIEKASKKQQQKAMDKIRAHTGTEGGTLSDVFKGKASGWTKFNVGVNALMTIGEYKEGRNEGKSVLGAATDAAVNFVGMEMLGIWGALGLGAIKGGTTLAAKTAKYTIESSRSMNNIQRFTPFADAQFQDNQQLATMRQSGMELAKMSQYNLQQTLMGTEARNLHR